MTRKTTLALAAVSLAGAAAGCGAGAGKVGGPAQPVTLRLADTDQGKATPAVLDFARRVKRLSHGGVTIELVPVPNTARDYERAVVKGTAAGKWDLGWVGTRTLDSVGVPSAGALQVPFLIDSYTTQHKVLTGPIGRRLTQDLSKAGVTGLGLLPDHLSYLVTRKRFTSLDDLAGRRMRAFGGSRSAAAAYAALGADPVPLNGTTTTSAAAMRSGRVAGFDATAPLWAETAYTGAVYTVGAPIWARTSALFAAPGRFDRLPKATQSILREAARQASQVDRTFATADARAIARICRLGATVDRLDATDRSALEQDAASRRLPPSLAPPELVGQIRAMKAGVPSQPAPPVPAGCGAQRPGATPTASGAPGLARARALRAALRPGSVFRSRGDYDTLERLFGADFAKNNSGTFTFRFLAGGRFTDDQKPLTKITTQTHVEGTYKLEGDVLAVTFGFGDGAIHERARCAVRRHGVVDCRILSDDGGLTTDPVLNFAGTTEPLVPVDR